LLRAAGAPEIALRLIPDVRISSCICVLYRRALGRFGTSVVKHLLFLTVSFLYSHW
jgi:hypothetical protein